MICSHSIQNNSRPLFFRAPEPRGERLVIDPPCSHQRAWMRRALVLARRGEGRTSPNPMVGAVLVSNGRIIGEGWHRKAGGPHAEIEAIEEARRGGHSTAGSILVVTLEPCCTQGRTPPCTQAIVDAGIQAVVAATADPNPNHSGRGFQILRAGGVRVETGVLSEASNQMNESFNHWIVRRTPFVVLKLAMTLDGRLATASGQSKWITGETARREGMRLRKSADAILVGVNTLIADDPSLTIRTSSGRIVAGSSLRRFVLDTRGRTPLDAAVLNDDLARQTTVVLGLGTSREIVRRLSEKVTVWEAPVMGGKIDLKSLVARMGGDGITRLIVEGGGEVAASFLGQGLVQRVAFFYAPKILGAAKALPGVGGAGASGASELLKLSQVRWRRAGEDLFLTARVEEPHVHWNS